MAAGAATAVVLHGVLNVKLLVLKLELWLLIEFVLLLLLPLSVLLLLFDEQFQI